MKEKIRNLIDKATAENLSTDALIDLIITLFSPQLKGEGRVKSAQSARGTTDVELDIKSLLGSCYALRDGQQGSMTALNAMLYDIEKRQKYRLEFGTSSLEEFNAASQFRGTLSDEGIGEKEISELAEKAVRDYYGEFDDFHDEYEFYLKGFKKCQSMLSKEGEKITDAIKPLSEIEPNDLIECVKLAFWHPDEDLNCYDEVHIEEIKKYDGGHNVYVSVRCFEGYVQFQTDKGFVVLVREDGSEDFACTTGQIYLYLQSKGYALFLSDKLNQTKNK